MSQDYFSDDNIIKSSVDFDYRSNGQEGFVIAYGIDKNFLFGCGVSIASIAMKNPQIDFSFHVFTDYFDQDEHAKFSALAKEYKTQIVVYIIDCEKLKQLPSTKNWTYATYFRFIIADYFSDKVQKVLYLDADIACKGSIKALTEIDFAGEIAAVVIEGDETWWMKRSEQLGVAELRNGYFNAGFLLINIPEWKKEDISTKAIDMLRHPEIVSKITHLDQDVLNILLVDKVRFIDVAFNTRFSINYQLKDKFIYPVNGDTVLIHYIGPTKPWHDWAKTYPVSASFLDAKNASPWKNTPLLKPHNSNQYRYCAKHQAKQKKYFLSIISYMFYFIKKLQSHRFKK